jgi:hypothetical protein
MPFWTQGATTGEDPKRKSKFIISMGAFNNDNLVWYAKSFKKPSFTIKDVSHKFLNHTFYYPGSLEWDAVDLTVVDPVDPIDTVGTVALLLTRMGYNVPDNPAEVAVGGGHTTISKRRGVGALGAVKVTQIGDSSSEALETWTLYNCFLTKADLGQLDYTSDDLLEVKLTFRYDYATLELGNATGEDIGPESVTRSADGAVTNPLGAAAFFGAPASRTGGGT